MRRKIAWNHQYKQRILEIVNTRREKDQNQQYVQREYSESSKQDVSLLGIDNVRKNV